MNNSRIVLRVLGGVAICLMVGFAVIEGRHQDVGVYAQTPPTPHPIDETAFITPHPEDFPNDLSERLKYVNRAKEPAGSFLLPLPDSIRLVNVVGGGWYGRPMWWDEASIPAGGGVPDRFWDAMIRYIMYRLPGDARKNWRDENGMRQLAFSKGSFSGAKIGDECGHIEQPEFGIYEIHVVRSNVSINLSARVMLSPKVDSETDITDFRSSVEEALEATARIIVNRIDGVVKAKGTVDMTNLPPVKEIPQQ